MNSITSQFALVSGLVGLTTGVAALAFQIWQTNGVRRREYNKAIQEWANEALDLMNEIGAVAKNGTDPLRVHELSGKLRQCADRGRLFFVNEETSDSVRGYRRRILDWLVFYTRICEKQTPTGDCCQKLILDQLKRGFVKDVQTILEPDALLLTTRSLQRLLRSKEGPMDTSQSHEWLKLAMKWLDHG